MNLLESPSIATIIACVGIEKKKQNAGKQALSYAEPDENGRRWLLLCRVLLGELHYTVETHDPRAAKTATAAGRDSTVAHPGGTEPLEFIVPDATQVYAEYILEVE